MPLTSLALVVLAALIHAGWNLLAKRAAGAGAAFVAAYTFVAFVAYAPWMGWLLFQGGVAWSPAVIACLIASGMFHLAYSLALQRGYRVADLSVVYPVARGTGPLIASLGAVLLLGERPSLAGIAGLAAVLGGIALIATDGRMATFARSGAARGVRWGAGTGTLIAGYTVVDGWGVKLLGIHPLALDWGANALRLAMLTPAMIRNRATAMAAMRGHWPEAIGVGLFAPLGYILVLTALRTGAPLHVVAPLRELSMMAGALLAFVILREPVGPARLAGCALMVLGVVLLGRG
jgi:drug/metabolite transporter (DMT)-like permease